METKETLQSKILKQIQERKIKQKPKWQFVFEGILLLFFLLAGTFCFIYLTAFSDLITHENEFQKFLDIPLNQIDVMGVIQTLPLLIFFLLAVSFVLVYILIRKYSFSYEKPVIYTLVGMLFLVVLLTFFIRLLDPHRNFARLGDDRGIPLFGTLHDRYRDGKQGDLIRGVVTSVTENIIRIETFRSSTTVEVLIASTTKNSELVKDVKPGDEIIAFIKRESNSTQNSQTATQKALLIDVRPENR